MFLNFFAARKKFVYSTKRKPDGKTILWLMLDYQARLCYNMINTTLWW